MFSRQIGALQLCFLLAFVIGKSAAILNFTNPTLSGLTAGVPFNVTWSGASGTSTLALQNGTASSLNTVDVISCMLFFIC